ncbi:MAG: SDR family oxidoreductase [Candidatus Omnitrophica bacterium]|nr:SDR family oxidoreductase [Candidatus Omnitrophota bacterium]
MKKLKNKTVIITGGTKGIGAAIAKEFYAAGYHVVVGSRKDNGLAKRLGQRAKFCPMDVREEEGHQALVKMAIQWTKQLDVYINCAGFSSWRPVKEIDELFWDEMIDTNLKGTFWGCKIASTKLKKGGSIINISSLAGRRGSANNSVYCASKFGVTGLTQALAKELGPSGIRVNAICPVYVQTKGLLDALDNNQSPTQGKNTQKYLKDFAAQQAALKRLPLGREVAQTCLFFASDEASAITGQSLNVDCGVLPQ